MWISGEVFNKLNEERIVAIERAHCLSEQNKAHLVTQDFLRLRVNQLEKERAILLRHVTTIGIPVPQIEETPPSRVDYGEMPSFEDVGDDEALRLGVSHNPDGSIRYTK